MRKILFKPLQRDRIKGIFLQSAWRIGLCVALAVVAIYAVQVIGGMLDEAEPVVEVFQNYSANSLPTSESAELPNELRFAVAAMVSAEATFSTYNKFVQKIATDIGREEVFIVRPSYEDVRMELLRGEVDVALICTGTYVSGFESGRIKLLVQPEFEGNRTYRSLLIVPADSSYETWRDLEDKVMAFTDPESFTGCVLPSVTLGDRGQKPAEYFEKIIYTGSHDRSIIAVSTNVVDAACVDSLVWLSNLEQRPILGERVKIIWESQNFGPPPIVVPSDLNSNLETDLRRSLLTLHGDEDGRNILSEINIKRFVTAQPEDYSSALAARGKSPQI